MGRSEPLVLVRRIPTVVIIVTISISLLCGGVAAQDQRKPVVGDFFEYEYDIWLDRGWGNYEGYTEHTFSHGLYTVINVTQNTCTMKAVVSWEYRASDGTYQAGGFDHNITFSLDTRLYISGYELDENVTDPAVWFYAGTGLQTGQHVKIIGQDFVVQSTSSSVWMGWLPISGVELKNTGSFYRNDVYGAFTATFTDIYHFDGSTGYLLHEWYEEVDADGHGNGFRWREEVRVIQSSYAAPVHISTLLVSYVVVPGIIIGPIIAVIYRSYGPRRVRLAMQSALAFGSPTKERFVMKRVRRRRMPRLALEVKATAGLTLYFEPFMERFVNRAVATKSKIAVARQDGKLRAIILRERKTRFGSYFGPQELAVPMVKYLRVIYFHSEHPDGGEILERYKVLQLSPIPDRDYDTEAARPLNISDWGAVTRIWRKVYGEDDEFLTTAREDGDMCIVGVDEGALAGFGLCSVTGDVGRMHSLTVSPERRNRGIGRQISLARLQAMRTLGVSRVIMEVDIGNIPSLRIAAALGFSEIGETYIVTRKKGGLGDVPFRRWI